GPREARQDKHALLVVARGDELLGDEIHTVVKAGYDAEIRRPEELEHLGGLMVANGKRDRLVRAVLPSGVDRLGLPNGFRLKILVGAELAAGRGGRLDEDELSAPLGVGFEQDVDRPHAVENAFGVVEAFDPNRDPRIWAQSEAARDGLPAFLHLGLPRQRRRRPLDRDRIRANQSLVTPERDRGSLAVDTTLHEAIDR